MFCDTHTHTHTHTDARARARAGALENILTITSIAHSVTPFKRILKQEAILECRDFKKFSSQNILWIFKLLLLAFPLSRLLYVVA